MAGKKSRRLLPDSHFLELLFGGGVSGSRGFSQIVLIAGGDGEALIWTARPPGLWRLITGSLAPPDLAALVESARG